MSLPMKNIRLTRKMFWRVLILVGLLLSLALTPSPVEASSQEDEIIIHFFWGEGCPYCEMAKPVLESMAASDPRIELKEYEVYHSQENLEFFFEKSAAHGFEPQGVPITFIGDRYWVGYSEDIIAEMQAYLDQYLPSEVDKAEKSIRLPLIGSVNLSNRSMFFSTLLISFVDGVNPCSIWVLSMLLAIALNTQSRKKVLIIGTVFIFVTGLIYALFIGGLFSILRVVKFIGWIQVVVSMVALFFGLINIKDYFWYQEGLSFTISDEKKPGIYKGIRRVLNAEESIWMLIGSTVVLAAGVSLVEFSCTAGFPVLWTNLLTAQNVSTSAFLGLLLVYMIVYQIDEMGIFLVSVFTLRKTKLEEKHGRILKLLGGMLMLCLAAVMIINPALMNDLTQVLIIFGIAFGLTGLVLLVHRVVLPKFNIQFGSDQ